MTRSILCLCITVFLVVVTARDAAACRNGLTWYPAPRQVSVYYKTGTAAAANMTDDTMRRGIRIAVESWSELHGSSVQLRWAGDTTADFVNDAIVVKGEPWPLDMNGNKDCNGSIGHSNWAPPVANHFVHNEVQIYGNTDYGHMGSCRPITYHIEVENPEARAFGQDHYDLIANLMHELGHAQGLTHSDGSGNPTTCLTNPVNDPPPVSVMAHSATDRARAGTNYDRDDLRGTQGSRASYSTLVWKTQVNGTLISQNKPASASSVENSALTANYAFDGNANTRWSSQFADPQWISVDLGATYNLSRVILKWEYSYGLQYKIQASNDNINWTDLVSVNNGDGGTDDIQLVGSGRWVRMYGTVRGTPYGYSLWEFEVYGVESWGTSSAASGLNIGWRPASLSQAFPYTAIAWIDFPVNYFALGRWVASYYSAGTFNYSQSLANDAVPSSGGMAASKYSNEVLSAYRKQSSNWYYATSYEVCYRRSTNGGQTWGTEVCPFVYPPSPRPNVTVAYDPSTMVFLIAYAQANGQISVNTVPETGSPTLPYLNNLSEKAWHAPSIACSGTSAGCRMVWDNLDSLGCLTWYEAQVNSAGQFIPSVKRTQCYEQVNTPSVAYSPKDGTFRLAFIQGTAAYSYKMLSTGTSWTGTGDIWNNASTSISPPTLATEYSCLFSCSGNVRTWLLRYYP